MKKNSYYIVNTITFYRLLTAPILVFLIAWVRYDIFKWMLAVSFFTDAIDGLIARHYIVTSVFGSSLDSIADDLTIVAAIIGIFVFKREFLMQYMSVIFFLLALFFIQMIIAIARYGKISSFHTYSAKFAAIQQAVFILLLFFLVKPVVWLFFVTAAATVINLVEEIILVMILPEWKVNVKGLFWIIKENKTRYP